MAKRYYTAESGMGSRTSKGFANDTIVKVWESRRARDKYLENVPNISARAIRRSEVTREATNLCLTSGKYKKPDPFKGQCWCIVDALWSGLTDTLHEGCVGQVEVFDPRWSEESHSLRFYK